LEYQVQLIGSHGHTTFHQPSSGFTHQLGDGAAIAATTGIHVISDLRNMDVALGGQGAPIVPVGEKLLLKDYDLFLNIGGIANLSVNDTAYLAFDVCPANRVLNLLAATAGKPYDEGGALARIGQINEALLNELNDLDYYRLPFPKSLANSFGTDIVYPLILRHGLSTTDALCTFTEHIALQITSSIRKTIALDKKNLRLLVTGGGAFNLYLLERLQHHCPEVEWIKADDQLIQYKEALIMAFMAVLRWREESNVFSSVTGAKRDSIGGAVWAGHD